MIECGCRGKKFLTHLGDEAMLVCIECAETLYKEVDELSAIYEQKGMLKAINAEGEQSDRQGDKNGLRCHRID